VLLCLLRYDHLPVDVLTDRLAEVKLPIPVSVALPPPEDRALSDVWSALGGELKPSLDLVVISPFQAGSVDDVGNLVREGLRLNFAISDHGDEDRQSEGKTSKTSRRGKGSKKGVSTLSPAAVRSGQETIVGGTADQRGRVFHMRDTTYRAETGDGGRE
jgi:hypothetical protein